MKKEIYGVYSNEADMTFILEDVYDDDGEILSTECVGFYHGEPNDEDNAYFTGKLKAEFLMGRDKEEPQDGAESHEEETGTFVVVGEYADGRKVTVRDPLKHPVDYKATFRTEKEAAAFAAELNNRITEDLRHFFPVYRAERA